MLLETNRNGLIRKPTPLGKTTKSMSERRDKMESDQKEVQLVIFLLNQVEFAVSIGSVREVLKKQKVIPLPKTPSFMEGVINLRGEVIPVVDLRKRFSLPEDVGGESRIIIVEMGTNLVGLIVDKITEVLYLPHSQVLPTPSGIKGEHINLIEGIGNDDGRLLIILDLEYILSNEEQLALEDITAAVREALEALDTDDQSVEKLSQNRQ